MNYRDKKREFQKAYDAWAQEMARIVKQESGGGRELVVFRNNANDWLKIRLDKRDAPIISYGLSTAAIFAFDRMPTAKKALLSRAFQLEKAMKAKSKELHALEWAFQKDHPTWFDAFLSEERPGNSWEVAKLLNSTVEEDIKNKDALFKQAQELIDAETVFLQLGKLNA